MALPNRPLLVPFLCASVLGQSPLPKGSVEDLHAPFDRILHEAVRDERVDYLAIRDRHFPVLTGYLTRLAEVDPRPLPPSERLALLINLYNATMIRVVCERFAVGYTTAADDWRVFDEPLVRVRDETLSLNQLEHERIRKAFGDPRIHVALVCGAASCPPILPRAYRGADLGEVLDANMRRFLADRRRNRIGPDRIELSRIFEWYADDFGGKAALRDWVARYVDHDVGAAEIRFLDYSWQLNIAPPTDARRYVRTTRRVAWSGTTDGEASGFVEAHQVLEVVGEDRDTMRVLLPFGRDEANLAKGALAPASIGDG